MLSGSTSVDSIIDLDALSRAPGRAAAARSSDHDAAASLSASGLSLVFDDGEPFLPPNRERAASLFLKRAMDIVLASLGLLFLLPFMVAVAILIRATSPGPIFFKQPRVGLSGAKFEIYKFRTMHHAACDIEGTNQAKGAGDSRLTAIGGFLRSKSIDELPQLINVIRGDMALVGPRPHVAGMIAAGQLYEGLLPYYDRRHVVRPGLTGWAQVNGYRGPTHELGHAIGRVHHDLAYIQNLSIALDIRILVLTVWREMFVGTGS
jgi:lipopolysaccharide/colanic/teichoic acid biosynthesis glycosyltransferase